MASQVSRFGGGGSAAHRPAGKQGKSGKTHKTERHGAKSKKTGLQSGARVEGRSQSGRWRGHEDTDAQRRLPLPEVVAVWGGEQDAEQLTDEEVVEVEMLQLFAQQYTWARRNVLVAQKAAVVEFDIGMETITQQQDHDTGDHGTGGVVWDAAIILAGFIHDHAAQLGLPLGDTARWLEVGAGCGATGIVAAKLLPVHTVLTDQLEILPVLLKNVQQNGCTARARVARLDWGADGETELPEAPFDVILVADCVRRPLRPAAALRLRESMRLQWG